MLVQILDAGPLHKKFPYANSMIAFEDFPTSVRLLLLTIRWQLSAGERLQCRGLIETGIDWNDFLALASHHRVESLVFEVISSLNAEDTPGIPQEAFFILQQQARSNAFLAVLAATETNRIVRRFAQEGFALAALKGVALSQQAYGSASARNVGDIDLLSTSDHLPRQVELLAELGYPLTIPDVRLTPRRIASFKKYWKDCTFASPRHEFPIELHWRLFNNSFHPGNRLLAAATFTTETVFNLPLPLLAPSDQFLYQAAHGVSDAWIYLKTLADVAAYLRVLTPEEVDAALARASSIGLLTHVSAAIHLANDWLGANFHNPRLLAPDHALGVAVRARTERMLRLRNFRPDRDDPSPADWTRLELDLIPGLPARLEIVRRILNRPRLWSRVDLPDRLFWLYPVLGALLPPRHHTPKSDLPPAR